MHTTGLLRRGLVPVALIAIAISHMGLGSPASALAQESPAVVDRPDIVRGFNTYGAAMTEQNVDELRNEYGANVVRLQIHPQNYAAKHKVSLDQAWDAVLDETERGLQEAARQGLMTVVDLHSVPIPGSKNAPAFWADDATADALVSCWEEIVQRLAPYREYIWGYDLLNEPHNTAELPLGAAKWPDWAQQMTDAIRVLDETTAIIYEASPGALPRGFIENEWIDAGPGYPVQFQGEFELLDDDNVIYSMHWYELHSYTHQGIGSNNASPVSEDWPDKMVYPGTNGGVTWDEQTLRELMQPVVDFQEKYDVPIYIGEFSAIRWAPGASEYIRDSVALFEEFGWSWTYHSYRDWHGWQLDYTDTMTSDANSASAIATQPTDRELTLKAHFSRNEFVTPLETPRPTVNLLTNGDFSADADADGLGDGWSRGAAAQTAIGELDGSPAQQVTVATAQQKGLDQEWVTVSDQRRYLLTTKIRVDQGQVRFWHYGVTSTYGFAGSAVAAVVDPTAGAAVERHVELVPAPGTTKLSVRFWANSPASFVVDDVTLIDLGPAIVVHPPVTTVTVTSGTPGEAALLQFTAIADPGSAIDRTEYRIVGASEDWQTVAPEGLTLTEPGEYLVGYRSVDDAGRVEAGRAVVVTVVPGPPADTTRPSVTVKDGTSFTVGTDGTYSLVSFKLHDAGLIDKVVLNGVVKDLTNNAWSDVNFVKPGTFGAVAGENTLVAYDVTGNTETVVFELTD